MRVLLVASGALPIPPPGWGAVEQIVWQQKTFLEQAGHDVDILNKPHEAVWNGLRSRPWQYDLVHLHHDVRSRVWCRLSRLLRFPLAITTHTAYAAFPEHWTPKYRRFFFEMLKSPSLIVLSEEIGRVVAANGYRGEVFVLPNGISCEEIAFAPVAQREALVLGRIEPRKKQAYLTELLRNQPVTLDLIGPTNDSQFAGNGQNVQYRGEWTREQVAARLCEYACLVLLSDGEAHALVTMEAMAAGLSLVVSPESSHNLDTSLPFIHIVDREDGAAVSQAIQKAVAENARYRAQIRRWCCETFDWSVIGPRYVKIIEQNTLRTRLRRTEPQDAATR